MQERMFTAKTNAKDVKGRCPATISMTFVLLNIREIIISNSIFIIVEMVLKIYGDISAL